MNQKKRIAITGINPFSGNRGVGALAISTLLLLNDIGKKSKIKIEFYTINNNFGKNCIDIKNESIQIEDIHHINIFSIKGIIKLLVNPKMLRSLIKYLKIDYVLCMGEGDSFSDIYGEQRFNIINNQHRLARFFKKKYLLLPQTIGPFNSTIVKRKAVNSIEKAEVAFARDKGSFNFVKENTNQKNIFEIIDVAFFMPFVKQNFSDKNINVGLNVSALLWHGGYTRNNQFGLKCDYPNLVKLIIEYFHSLPDVKIHLVPHVVETNSSLENDYEVSFNLVNEYNDERIVLAPFFLTPILAKNYIAGLDFFMGARMHATIAAFSSGVPVFPMAYSRKFNGLFINTLDYKYLGDMVNYGNDDIIQGIIEVFKKRENLKLIIQEKLNGIVEQKKKILDKYLTDFLQLDKD